MGADSAARSAGALPFGRSILPVVGLVSLLLYAGGAFLFGLALGERGELGVVQYVFTAVIPLAGAVLAFVARRGKAQVLATGAAMLAGLLLGQQQFERAFAGCVNDSERVRQALLQHQARTGGYPARLEDLGIELPCRCGMRTTILHYFSNERGFRLWFSDDATAFTATDRSPFAASGGPSAPPPR